MLVYTKTLFIFVLYKTKTVMLSKIYDFCAIREEMRYDENSKRFAFLTTLLHSLDIAYNIDRFEENGRVFKNIILDGTGEYVFTAHYDVLNINSDNANDNSASVINLIYLKTLRPEARVVLLDGEEPPMLGAGSRRLSKLINSGLVESVKGIINLELTGYGDGIFTDSRYQNDTLKVDEMKTDFVYQPFNDSEIFMENGIASVCFCLLPLLNGKADMSPIYDIHTQHDSVDKVSLTIMEAFVRKLISVYFR
jgi:hypothetical protein